MKVNLLFCCFFILICSLYGQPDKNYQENKKSYQEQALKDFIREFPCSKIQSHSSNSTLDSITFYEINMEVSKYTGKIVYLYNTNNELIATEEYEPDMFPPPRDIITENYVYNSHNKIERIDFTYGDNPDIPNYVSERKTYMVERRTYNKEGLLIKKEIFTAHNQYYLREESFTYYDDGSLKTYYLEYRKDRKNTVINEMYIYPDTTENMKVTITLRWNNVFSEWLNYKKTLINLNPSGNRISWIDSFWDMEKNSWQDYAKEEITYDQQNEVLNKILYTFDSMDKSWIERRKIEYEYHTDGDIKNINYYSILEFLKTWYLDGKHIYHYSDKITDINKSVEISDNIRMFPNPANNWLTIRFASNTTGIYSIYDLQGQLLISGKINNIPENNIDISFLDNGIYVFQIQIKNTGNQVFKFVKR